MLALWVVSHAVLIACGVLSRLEDPYWGGPFGGSPFAAVCCSFLSTITVFALLFLTASLVGTLCRWLRAGTGRAVGLSAVVLAYAIGLGTLTASVVFAYPVGFSAPSRLAFAAFAVMTCGLLCAGREIAA